MDVLSVLAALAAALFVLGAPGLPTVLALRMRPLPAIASVVPLSLALIAATAELGHVLSIPWTVLSPLVLGLVLGAIVWGIGRIARGPQGGRRGDLRGSSRTHRSEPGVETVAADDASHDDGAARIEGADEASPAPATPVGRFLTSPRGQAAAVLTGLVIGIGSLLVQGLRMMGSIDAISQTYDNVFHLNAVRHILRAGDGSAWVVGGMTTLPGEETFYPALWHQTVSLVVQLSGQEIILASNIVMLLAVAVIWPLGMATLVRTATASGPMGWMAAGALAGITSTFPLAMMSWGILLPYLLSLSLMPLVLAAVAHVATLAPAGPHRLTAAQTWVLLVAACASVALAHPQGVFVGLILGVPMLVWAVLVRAGDLVLRRPRVLRRLVPLALVTAAVMYIGWTGFEEFRPSESSAVWEPNATQDEAIAQALSLAGNGAPAWWPLGAVVLVCALAVLIGSRSRWLVPAFAAAAWMSVITRSTPMGDFRYQWTGTWYSDNYRITAIVAVAAVPLLAVGLDVLARWAVRLLPVLRGAAGPVAAVAVVLVLLAASIFSPSMYAARADMAWHWRNTELLTPDERALLEQLPEVVPEDAVIATNAWNGSSLAYAISDRPVLNTFMGFQAEDEVHLLNRQLDDAQTDPAVCDAMEDLHVEYALDFGPEEMHGNRATYTGLNEISQTGAAEVVLQVGDAKLLRMLPCRGTDGSMNG
ncbi:DUF6541 family protein [Brachybacterium aquaticum]|uniref:Uncharacterized protein n=1 Tax=Brachybacterium aquaticum TaxID=1432564 RepID=A0A841AAV0_9MICO|nr:DUF6541 family protein [Brachybacterium aquaticum]MBB5830360.1 hypothetical protein [Brachybacterium aquaticum]